MQCCNFVIYKIIFGIFFLIFMYVDFVGKYVILSLVCTIQYTLVMWNLDSLVFTLTSFLSFRCIFNILDDILPVSTYVPLILLRCLDSSVLQSVFIFPELYFMLIAGLLICHLLTPCIYSVTSHF